MNQLLDGFRKIPLSGTNLNIGINSPNGNANGNDSSRSSCQSDLNADVAQFYHYHFMRGHESRLSCIKRKVISLTSTYLGQEQGPFLSVCVLFWVRSRLAHDCTIVRRRTRPAQSTRAYKHSHTELSSLSSYTIVYSIHSILFLALSLYLYLTCIVQSLAQTINVRFGMYDSIH